MGAQKRGADVHPTSGGSRCRISPEIAAARHPGRLLLPALAHAGSRQTDASTAAKPDGTRCCRVKGTAHEPVAGALLSLQPSPKRPASPFRGVLGLSRRSTTWGWGQGRGTTGRGLQ